MTCVECEARGETTLDGLCAVCRARADEREKVLGEVENAISQELNAVLHTIRKFGLRLNYVGSRYTLEILCKRVREMRGASEPEGL